MDEQITIKLPSNIFLFLTFAQKYKFLEYGLNELKINRYMSKLISTDKEYAVWVADLKHRFRSAQIKAAVKVNRELLIYYWQLGRDMVNMNIEERWGEGIMKTLSQDLKDAMPEENGFSKTNLYYIKKFYTTYSQIVISFPQVGGKIETPHSVQFLPQVGEKEQDIAEMLFSIPWTHHKFILDKIKGDVQKGLFFVAKAMEGNWSRAVLLNHLDTDLYERTGNAVNNFCNTLPTPQSELAKELLHDPYNFDFLTMTEGFKEKELKQALIDNIIRFLMELGSGFAFMGQEYRLQVSSKEQFLDLLFYNTRIHSYVVIEVKVTEFEPSYLGQLSAYMSFVNHTLKSDADNPTIGLLICKSKDNIFAQYSLEGYNQPIGISEFEGVNLMPKEFKSSLPSIEDIEAELEKKSK